MSDLQYWQGKNVFLTGHTGFKGSWLSILLTHLGARVHGYALKPDIAPSMFDLCQIANHIQQSDFENILGLPKLKERMALNEPEVVFHLAAQALVQESYVSPVETYATNVLGTVHVLEAVRSTPSVRAVIIVTSDKCYEDQKCDKGYQEGDRLGGFDPYSNSKACAEMVTSAYRNSFFHSDKYSEHNVAIASVRAGNVIGGGDWATQRLVPDCIRAFLEREQVRLRNPGAIRPWQHVLEPLSGYITLASKLATSGSAYSGEWNFGPCDDDMQSVEWVTKELALRWFENVSYSNEPVEEGHETHCLKLNSNKARELLGWNPSWSLSTTLDKIVEWLQSYREKKNLLQLTVKQIEEYLG
ncbi:CDP-glucose 4,6-dehydratase [Oligoflexia bacterium]|nr:CDP-glucose 4,6-dehydratase [Oligoflexia bacterium]